jgi:hypothetical protein
LIWDNIHANDYDPRRIFLGPYDGRSPEIIPYLRGVLTNPNTEFESNYVALHSLGQWCISNTTGLKRDVISGKFEKLKIDNTYMFKVQNVYLYMQISTLTIKPTCSF